jgi:hypothetical protein
LSRTRMGRSPELAWSSITGQQFSPGRTLAPQRLRAD